MRDAHAEWRGPLHPDEDGGGELGNDRTSQLSVEDERRLYMWINTVEQRPGKRPTVVLNHWLSAGAGRVSVLPNS